MSMTHVRKRLLPFVIGTLAASLAGVVSAQSNPSETNDSVSAASQPSAAGSVAVLHTPGEGADRSDRTNTPIKHVILLIGENRTFDHVFATYTPPKGQTVNNLLSEGIVNADGTPGPHVAAARQWQASNTGAFSVAPPHTSAYPQLPAMNTGGAPTQAPFASAAQAQAIEPGLPTAA